MALNATIYQFDIELADADRARYETLALRVARHPSEAEDYLIARVLAYALNVDEGLAWSRGLSTPDEPAIAARDLTGALTAWIDVGLPDAPRLHRAAKAAARVAVYAHKDTGAWLRALAGQRIHRAEALELYALPRGLVEALVTRLARRNAFALAVSGGELFLTLGDETLHAPLVRLPAPTD